MIKNIIFDLGNVLVNVEYEGFRKKITEQTGDEKYDSFFRGDAYRLLGYEAGRISTDEFISRCISGLGLDMTEIEFADAFNDMFSEIKPMSSLLRDLNREDRFNLYLLSNTSPLHFEYIKENFDFINLIHRHALSYELKSLKPEREIYEKTIDFLNIKPEESLFIDDLEENCIAAEEIGIKTICYDKKNHENFLIQFNKIRHN
ncbi:MAG: HAD family phosphatase [Ignavibacteria bacterium]|nr:HAD family phosphatase [Ignavibacteria bacterium]